MGILTELGKDVARDIGMVIAAEAAKPIVEKIDESFEKEDSFWDRTDETIDKGINKINEIKNNRIDSIHEKIRTKYPNCVILYENFHNEFNSSRRKYSNTRSVSYLDSEKIITKYRAQGKFEARNHHIKLKCGNSIIGSIDEMPTKLNSKMMTLFRGGKPFCHAKYSLGSISPTKIKFDNGFDVRNFKIIKYDIYYQDKLFMKVDGKRIIIIDKEDEEYGVLIALAIRIFYAPNHNDVHKKKTYSGY